jgi:copper chaperone NosL
MNASCKRRTTARLRRAALVAAIAVLAGCAQDAGTQAAAVADETPCALDGMLLADYPGPKGQISYDQGAPDFFCDTVELVAALLAPEQRKRVVAVYTQDMAQTSWDKPQGHWIDARSAFYVFGSRKTGSMGPTLATFARDADAQAFARDNGGKVLRFADIRPEMVSLDGGVLKDSL